MNTIHALYRYLIKGLSAEQLDRIEVKAGQGFPRDRQFAITNGTWDYSEDEYAPRPKTDFLALMKHESLAVLKSKVVGDRLTIRTPDGATFEASLQDETGRDQISQFFVRYLGKSTGGTPRVVSSKRFRFTDVSVSSPSLMESVSLINLASVRELEAQIGQPLNPLRFRANIYFDGARPWEELNWLDREIRIGHIRARVLRRTRRCAATNVNPDTGIRDRSIPQALLKTYGHADLGVYAELLEGGELTVGLPITSAG